MKKSLLIGLALFVMFMVQSPAWGQELTLTQLHQEIRAKGAGWEPGETSMTKLSPEERKMRLGALPSLAPDRGKVLSAASVTASYALAPSLDWRNNGGNYVSGIRDQGNCGSCWAFAATAALESYTMINTKRANTDLNLSEQVALSCSGAGSCAGGYVDAASNFMRDTGLPADGCYPYTVTDGTCASACANWKASTYKIKDWSWVVKSGSLPAIDKIKGALSDHGPLIATMHVYYDFFSYKSGIYKWVSGAYQGDHAVLVVGYDDAGQYFIVKNSWGTGWGESGFFKIAYTESAGGSWFGFETIAYTATDDPSPTCDYAPGKLFSAAGGSGGIRVTLANGCAWTATSDSSWITIASGSSGTGSGIVRYTVAANTGAASRTGTITVAGHTNRITQAGGTQTHSATVAGTAR